MKRKWSYYTKLFFGSILITLSIGSGWAAQWLVMNVGHRPLDENSSEILHQVFIDAHVSIDRINNHCENVLTVSEVLTDLIVSELRSKVSKLKLNCELDKTGKGRRCWLLFSDCRPWQSIECGSRHLGFEVDQNVRIVPGSYSCVDVP
jgi:hypothetical protein